MPDLSPAAAAFRSKWRQELDSEDRAEFRADLAALLAAERRRALLEAAEIAEAEGSQHKFSNKAPMRVGREIAAALRARAEEGETP